MRDWLLFGIGFLVGQLALIIYLYLDAYLQHLEAQDTAEPEPQQPAHHIDNVTIIGEHPPIDPDPLGHRDWDYE